MGFNFLSEDYRKKHAMITRWNKDKNNNLMQLFLDEYKELTEALKQYKTSFIDTDVRTTQILKGDVMFEIADCLITMYHLCEANRELLKNEIEKVFEIYREYKCNELNIYIMLKIERTLRFISEGVYD